MPELCLDADADGTFGDEHKSREIHQPHGNNSSSSSLHEEVDVVDAQRVEFGVWSLNVE